MLSSGFGTGRCHPALSPVDTRQWGGKCSQSPGSLSDAAIHAGVSACRGGIRASLRAGSVFPGQPKGGGGACHTAMARGREGPKLGAVFALCRRGGCWALCRKAAAEGGRLPHAWKDRRNRAAMQAAARLAKKQAPCTGEAACPAVLRGGACKTCPRFVGACLFGRAVYARPVAVGTGGACPLRQRQAPGTGYRAAGLPGQGGGQKPHNGHSRR